MKNKSQFWFFKEGESAVEQGKYSEAVDIFKRTVDVATLKEGASFGNRVYHLGFARFMAGDRETGLQEVEDGYSMIRDELDAGKGPNEEHQLLIWLTGAMQAKAQCLNLNGEKEQARKLLQEALVIAEENDLSVRKEQLSRALSDY